MSEYFFLEWAIAALSLFNAIVLLWLGLTVLLNADRRHWGVWLMSGGLLAGALFFVSHSAIVNEGVIVNMESLNAWWQVGWLPVIFIPYAWYVVVIWYSGYWSEPDTHLHRRHKAWLIITSLGFGGLLALVLGVQPIPPYDEILQAAQFGESPLHRMPLLLTGFVVLMVSCIVLSLDALLRPTAREHTIRSDARQIGTLRARPWLLATALVLLSISLLVVFLLAWTVNSAAVRNLATSLPAFARFDLVLGALIALASLLLGQAIVAHEIFTGKALPRRAFVRHWRAVVLLAAGYALVVGLSLAAGLRPIYSLLLTTLLMATFFALYSWRTFLDREQFFAHLRPVVGRRGTLQLGRLPDASASYASDLFQVICHDVLGARRAQLVPLGSFALLAGPGYIFPAGEVKTKVNPSQLDAYLQSRICGSQVVALGAPEAGNYDWAIPLWSERGVIGALLIGAKADGGLYSQEEVEIAQASGERVLDILASEQMARRLLAVQRKRVVEQQLVDMKTRRLLHDEILPALHLTVLRLSGLQNEHQELCEATTTVADVHRQIANLLTVRQAAAVRLGSTGGSESDLGTVLADIVRVEFAHAFDSICWQRTDPVPLADGACGAAAETMIGAAREAIRNAARHGRGGLPNRPLHLTLAVCADEEIRVHIQDSGVGMRSPNGETDGGGSGSGLALHSTLLAIAGGYLAVESAQAGGTIVTLSMPCELLVPETA